ncbi:MAG: hypothetical protein ACRC8S_22805 [Fimbriiglobus sp.]
MTTREKLIALLLVTFMALLIVGGLGYLLVWVPLDTANAEAAKIEQENNERKLKLETIKKDMERLKINLRRSLPTNLDIARVEYDAVVTRALKDSKIPASSISVKPKAFDVKSAPEITPKKPAYAKIGLEITLRKVSMAQTVDFLQKYYKLNLLHQITKFTLKKADDASRETTRSFGGSTSLIADKSDLDVVIVTEAICMDGAENRRSLLPVSEGFALLGGNAGYQAVLQSSEPTRALTPMQLAKVLAANDRDYSMLLVKDIFHGSPPPQPAPPAPRLPEPKEDTSPYIRITGLGVNSDGSGSAMIEDVSSKQEYVVDVSWVEKKLVAEVTKYDFAKGNRRSFGSEPDLEISDSNSSTKRKFRVIGFAEEALIIAEKPSGDAPTSAPGGFAPKRPTTPGKTETNPEKIYAWHAGEPLNGLKELTGAAKDRAVRLASGLPATPDRAPVATETAETATGKSP